MCDPNFRIGYSPCVRERAIDLLLEGYSKSHVARLLKLTWPTVDKWLKEFTLASHEIDAYLTQ